MSPSDPQHGDASGDFRSQPLEAIEVVNSSGDSIRYAAGDFDELYTTSDPREMRRHLDLGWLLLDKRVGRDRGVPPPGSTRPFGAAPAASSPPRTIRTTNRPKTSPPTFSATSGPVPQAPP